MSLAFEIKTYILHVKGGYFTKSCLTNCAKMRILKMGVPLFKLAFFMYC